MAKTKDRAPTKPTPKKKSNAGRPSGGGVDYTLNNLGERDNAVTKCPKCGSTKRSDYYGVTRQPYAGRVIVRKRCRCLACGQHRIDRYEVTAPM